MNGYAWPRLLPGAFGVGYTGEGMGIPRRYTPWKVPPSPWKVHPLEVTPSPLESTPSEGTPPLVLICSGSHLVECFLVS